MLYLKTGVCERTRAVDSCDSLSQLDRFFNEGRPFFSKDSLRNVQEQLQQPLRKGDRIRILDLSDMPVFFEVKTGDCQAHLRVGDIVYTAKEPTIQYVSYQSLRKRIEFVSESPDLAFCSLRIQHTLTRHNNITGEPADDFKFKSKDEVRRLFSTALEIWEESGIWAEIKRTLSSAATAGKITKIIGFGCGIMSASDDVPHISYNAAFQHALLLTLQQFLQQSSSHEITCAVQDPAYTDRDISVLCSHGIEILKDPEGFIQADDSSLVFACAPDVPVRQVVADIARPAVLMWDKVSSSDDLTYGMCLQLLDSADSYRADPDSPRIRKMIWDSYDYFDFPYDEHFGDIAIYVRRGLNSQGQFAQIDTIA